MLKLNRTVLLFVAAILAKGALASGFTDTSLDYGVAVTNRVADRTVTLTPSTKYANVNNGETVKFVVDGNDFEWHFDTAFNGAVVDLSKIAPQEFHANNVRVYVDRNPLYSAGQ